MNLRLLPRRLVALPLLALVAVSALVLAPGLSMAASGRLEQLRQQAPDISEQALALALSASDCAIRSGQADGARRLAVIDYSLPSTQPRLWVFDLARSRLLYRDYVAHGQGSGENFATTFSDVEGSHQSSLGLFRTADTYIGGNGYSLRLDGLEQRFNGRARERLIVMHGAPYVDPDLARRQGRLGRSWGCPALRPAVAQTVIDQLKQGQLLFAYYPDPDWLASSTFLRCPLTTARTADTPHAQG